MTAPTRYAPLSVADLIDLQLPDRDEIVEGGILVAGSVTLFTARAKSGKTMFSTDLACCVAGEEPFLDRAVTPGPVIFVALEENIREVRGRFLDRLGSRRTVPLFVLPANGFTDDTFGLDDPMSMSAFAQMIAEFNARVVIIDTMREAHGLRENESDDMARLARPLRQIAHETNCAIVLLHHLSKAGSARGSTAIAAAADQLWTFQRTDTEQDGDSPPVGKLTVEGRFGPRQTLCIRLGDGLRWEVDTTIGMSVDHTMRDRVLAALRQGGVEGLTAKDIAGRLDANLKSVQNEISRLLQERPAPLTTTGTGKKSDPRRYAVIDPTLFPSSQTLGGGNHGNHFRDDSQRSGNDGNQSLDQDDGVAGLDRWTA